ncbi:MAG: hypothetical protein HC914_19855, partial [Chloroflexaceae bacterium]|nr:hypothetical protein [Chloroflexaceae bacterium]
APTATTPTNAPTATPTNAPSAAPSDTPSDTPTDAPTDTPSATATATETSTPVAFTCDGSQQLGPWSVADIGDAATLPGTTRATDATVFLCGAGSQLWGTVDGLRYVYRSTKNTSNFTITARLTDWEAAQRYSKVGLMFRSSTAANAQHYSLVVTNGDGVRVQWRSGVGFGSVDGGGTGPGTPVLPTWLRLTRTGNELRAYYSTATTPVNGDWVQVGQTGTFVLPPTYLAGMFASSRDVTTFASGTFTDVVFGTVPPTPTPISGTPLPTATPTPTRTPLPDGVLGHPRLFFNYEDLPALRTRLDENSSLWQSIRTMVDNQIDIAPPCRAAPERQCSARDVHRLPRVW